VQPRGAVDGDGLAFEIPVSDPGRLQELVEFGSHITSRRKCTDKRKINLSIRDLVDIFS
jgi:DNA-binding sugar fermentation-stimulating protein